MSWKRFCLIHFLKNLSNNGFSVSTVLRFCLLYILTLNEICIIYMYKKALKVYLKEYIFCKYFTLNHNTADI